MSERRIALSVVDVCPRMIECGWYCIVNGNALGRMVEQVWRTQLTHWAKEQSMPQVDGPVKLYASRALMDSTWEAIKVDYNAETDQQTALSLKKKVIFLMVF